MIEDAYFRTRLRIMNVFFDTFSIQKGEYYKSDSWIGCEIFISLNLLRNKESYNLKNLYRL